MLRTSMLCNKRFEVWCLLAELWEQSFQAKEKKVQLGNTYKITLFSKFQLHAHEILGQ